MTCLIGRTAVLVLRPRKQVGGERPVAREATVAFPAKWKRSTLLAYARAQHPTDTVRLAAWHPISSIGGGWDPELWLANPKDFADYKTGRLK